MSQITTHVLDTSKGKPAFGIRISLYAGANDEWTELGWGTTNTDGRVSNLLENTRVLPRGIYKLRFETKDYFDKDQVTTFYPYVEIIFDVTAQEHYHVPLLLNPFGYTTYRGS